MVVRSLLTVLGYQADNKALNKYAEALKKVINFVKIAAVATAALGGAVLKLAGDMEQTEIAFETMLGSGEKADALIRDITDFAAKTPFELSGLIQSSKQLLAFKFGAEEIIPTMRNLGNIAAGVGRDKLPTLVRALGKIRVKGKATMEELNMLLEAGVPILDQLAANYGVSSEELFKMISKGKVAYGDVNKALADLSTGNGMFANLMEKQSRSFLGIISNIGDFFTNLGIAIGKDILPAAKEMAKYFLQFLETNKDIIKENIVKFLKGVMYGITFVIVFIRELIDRMGGLEAIGKTIGGVFDFIGGVFMFFAKIIIQLIKFLWPLRYIILGVIAVIKIWSIVQAILNAIMAANPITLIIIAIGILIALIVLLVQNWETVKKVLIEGWNNIVSFLSGVWNAIVKAFMEGWKNLVSFLSGIWNAMAGAATDIWNAIVKGFLTAWSGVVSFFKGIIKAIEKLWNSAPGFFSGVWNNIVNGLVIAWSGISSFFGGLWNTIINGMTTAWNNVSSFFTGVIDDIKNVWSGITDFFSNIWDNIINSLKNIWSGAPDFFGGLWEGIVNGFLIAWRAIRKIMEIPEVIIEWLKKVWGDLGLFFSGIWDGIVEGIKKAWDGLVSGLRELWDSFMNFIQPLIDSISGIFEFFFGGPSPEVATAGGTASAMGSKSSTTTVNSTVNMTVPPGTSEEVAQSVRIQSRKAVEEAWKGILKEGNINNPGGGS